MADPIRIHHSDSEDEVRARHERVVARLVELGPDEVQRMRDRDELPAAWAPIVRMWLKRDDKAKTNADDKPSDDGEAA
jgi:hypothetical protein